MTTTRTRRWRLGCLLAALVLATLAKHVWNGFDLAFYDAYNGPAARTSEEAKREGLWVARLRVDPAALENGDERYEVGEAWLEAAYVPDHFLVWFSYGRRAGWNYLCLRPKTSWHQGGFVYEVRPEYPAPFTLSGPGSKGDRFTQSGNDLYFQKVPLDLRQLKLTVTTYTYGKGEDITVGTARLTREE